MTAPLSSDDLMKRAEAAIARARELAADWATLPPGTYRRAGIRILAALDVATPEEQPDVQQIRRQAADIHARLYPAIECVLIDHVYELDDTHGRVDANLAELAHVYRELTGFDARTAASEKPLPSGSGGVNNCGGCSTVLGAGKTAEQARDGLRHVPGTKLALPGGHDLCPDCAKRGGVD